jgi:hypothetical protein
MLRRSISTANIEIPAVHHYGINITDHYLTTDRGDFFVWNGGFIFILNSLHPNVHVLAHFHIYAT